MAIASVPEQRMIDIASIARNPQNYKKHPPAQVHRVAASYRRFGQRKPLVVQERDARITLVAGECGLLALQHLAKENREKWGVAWCTLVPANWTDDEVLGYLTADNETQRGATIDEDFLADIIDRQITAGFHLNTLGLTDDDYKLIMKDREPFTPVEQTSTTQDEQKEDDTFSFGEIRQIVVQYPLDIYTTVIERLEQVRNEQGLETNAEVLLWLLNIDNIDAILEQQTADENSSVI